MSCGIYKITNKINNKVYIGKSVNIERRWREHKSDAFNLNKPERQHYPLYKAFRKYGVENFTFEILELLPADLIGKRERELIAQYDSTNDKIGYNITAGGDSEIKYNRAEIKKLWEAGKTRQQIVEITRAAPSTIVDILKELGIYNRQESLKRMAKQAGIPVKAYDFNGNLIQEYESCREAARALEKDGSGSTIGACCKGKRKSIYGFQWRYSWDEPPGKYGV